MDTKVQGTTDKARQEEWEELAIAEISEELGMAPGNTALTTTLGLPGLGPPELDSLMEPTVIIFDFILNSLFLISPSFPLIFVLPKYLFFWENLNPGSQLGQTGRVLTMANPPD